MNRGHKRDDTKKDRTIIKKMNRGLKREEKRKKRDRTTTKRDESKA